MHHLDRGKRFAFISFIFAIPKNSISLMIIMFNINKRFIFHLRLLHFT